MKAAVLPAIKQPFEIRDVVIDKPGPHEVLVRVAACGLCHSDWHLANGDLPMPVPAVLGHEAAGIVEAIGSDVRTIKVGDHVVTCALMFCGHCEQCVSGRTHTCTAKPDRPKGSPPRLKMDDKPVVQAIKLGGFAEQMLVHETAVVAIDRTMPLDRAALLGCGALTGLGAVFNAAKVSPGSKVVVIGCGGVGLNVIQGCRVAGATQIVAVDSNQAKESIARHFGATHFVQGGSEAVARVREITGGGVNFGFEVIGLPATIVQAVQMLTLGGLMTIVGATRADATIPLPGIHMIYNEWRIQGTMFGSAAFTRDIPRFIAMSMAGTLDFETLISERIPLGDINRGFADMLSGETQARKVITFDSVLADAKARA